MRTVLRLIPSTAILAAALVFCATSGSAKPEYTRRTKKDCEFCHPPNSRELNDAGKYYQEHRDSLQGYVPPPEKQADKKKDGSSAPPAKASK